MEFGSFMEFHVRDGLSQAQSFDESMDHVRQAEAWGLDGVWLAGYRSWNNRCLPSGNHMGSAALVDSSTAVKLAISRTDRVRGPLKSLDMTASFRESGDQETSTV